MEHAGFASRICAQSVRAVAVLGIEDHVGRLALRKDRAVLPVGSECSAGTDVGEKGNVWGSNESRDVISPPGLSIELVDQFFPCILALFCRGITYGLGQMKWVLPHLSCLVSKNCMANMRIWRR